MQKLRAPLLLSLLAIVFLWWYLLSSSIDPSTTLGIFDVDVSTMNQPQTSFPRLLSPKTPDRLIIPAIQLNVSILDMPRTNGTWMVPRDAVGRGNVNVLFAHSRVKLFKRIDQLGPNQEIFLYSANGTIQTFRPVVTLQTSPDSVHLLDEWPNALLLVTCDGATDQWRTIVVAEPVNGSKILSAVEGEFLSHEGTHA